MNPRLITRIRSFVFIGSAILALLLFGYALSTTTTRDLFVIRLVQWYAFCAAIFLYAALLISPLYHSFPNLPGKILLVKARKAIGVSAFFFGLIHGSLAFFGNLGGFAGLAFLSTKFLIAISLSFTGLIILALLAATSLHRLEKALGKRWKPIHRLVYLAGALVFTHALMIGTHYIDLMSKVAIISIALVAFLLILQMRRLDDHLDETMPPWPKFGVLTLIVAVIIVGLLFRIYAPGSGALSLGIHAQHLAQLQGGTTGSQAVAGPRYIISLAPTKADPGKPTQLTFTIFNADTGDQVKDFNIVHDKLMHLVIIDNDLVSYNHLHPELVDGRFVQTTTFAKAGLYRLYIEFSPKGGQDQALALSLPVGTVANNTAPNFQTDSNQPKTFGAYQVSVRPSNGNDFSIAQMSAGKQSVVFKIVDAKSGQPVTTLEPYLGAFGHLVMVKEDTYQYAHVHPLAPGIGTAGPEVSFQALAFGNFKPLTPGVYRAFGQFNNNGQLFVADFTIELKP